jgi:hypothetical protein
MILDLVNPGDDNGARGADVGAEWCRPYIGCAHLGGDGHH